MHLPRFPNETLTGKSSSCCKIQKVIITLHLIIACLYSFFNVKHDIDLAISSVYPFAKLWYCIKITKRIIKIII